MQLDEIMQDFESVERSFGKVYQLQDSAYYDQIALDEDKLALVLYCQQFAFSPDMLDVCADLLVCGDRQLEYKYDFPGDFEKYEYNPERHFQHLMMQIDNDTFEYPRTTLNEMPPEHSETGMFQWMEFQENNGQYDDHVEHVDGYEQHPEEQRQMQYDEQAHQQP